jgi:hypothetical protein
LRRGEWVVEETGPGPASTLAGIGPGVGGTGPEPVSTLLGTGPGVAGTGPGVAGIDLEVAGTVPEGGTEPGSTVEHGSESTAGVATEVYQP